MPATMWASGASKEKPAITPTAIITAIESELVAMSARVRPASTADAGHRQGAEAVDQALSSGPRKGRAR